VIDANGIPLAVGLSAANTHDSQLLEQLVDAVPAVLGPRGRPGRPRKRPAKLHADKGYDFPTCRRALRRRGISPRIARRGIESSTRLGRHRWKVERSLAWLLGCRRLTVRYERRADLLTVPPVGLCAAVRRQAHNLTGGSAPRRSHNNSTASPTGRRDGLGPVAIVDQNDHNAAAGQRHHCPGRSVPVRAVRFEFALDTRYREYHYADSI
jgi:transposase